MLKVKNMRDVSTENQLALTATVDFVYFWVFQVPTKVFRPIGSGMWRSLDTGKPCTFLNTDIERLHMAYRVKEKMTGGTGYWKEHSTPK